MKIGIKLVLGFLAIILITLVTGYFIVTQSQGALQKSIGESSVMLVQETLDAIDRLIESRVEQVETYALSLTQEEVLVESNQQFDEMENVQEYIYEKDEEWTSVPKEEITPFMQEIINNSLSQEIRDEFELKEFYKNKYDHEVFGEAFITNKYGANVAQSQKTSDYYQADEEWWQKAEEDGVYVGDVDYDSSAEIYSLDLCARINDKNWTFMGVVKAVLNIEEVISKIKELEQGEERGTTDFKLLTKDGKIMYSTEEYEIFENVSADLFSRFRDVEEAGHKHYFIEKGDTPGEGEELIAHSHSRGYKAYKGLGWFLAVEYETGEMFAPVTELTNKMLIITGGVAILVIITGIYISRSISKPITKLRDATIEIGKGKLGTRIEIQSKDEVGDLANAFNKMSSELKESQERLVRSERLAAIGELATMVGHDLRNPLSAIQNACYYMKMKIGISKDEKLRKMFEVVGREINHANSIVEDLLDFSRIKKPELKKVDLISSIQDALTQLKFPENITLTKKFSEAPTIEADPDQLRRVFQNITLNGVQAMPNGGELTVSTRKNGDHIEVAFTDTGVGIPEENMGKLFTPLFTTKAQGVGLGLSICKNLVEGHNGRIEVKSKVGGGSTFTVKLPIHQTKGGGR